MSGDYDGSKGWFEGGLAQFLDNMSKATNCNNQMSSSQRLISLALVVAIPFVLGINWFDLEGLTFSVVFFSVLALKVTLTAYPDMLNFSSVGTSDFTVTEAPPDEDDIRTVFQSMDADGGGEIDLEEFEQAMQRLGIKPIDYHFATYQDLFEKIDTDGGGTIDFREFNDFMVREFNACQSRGSRRKNYQEIFDKALQVEDIHKIFKQIDTDNGGSLDLDEFKQAMHLLHVKPGNFGNYEKMFRSIDADNGGSIDFEEFQGFLMESRDGSSILEKAGDRSLNPLISAIVAGDRDDIHKQLSVENLMNDESIVNARSQVKSMRQGTAAHVAVKVGDLETLQLLYERNADFTLTCSKGGTLLHWVAEYGSNFGQQTFASLKWLVELEYDDKRILDVNHEDNEGSTPLHWAVNSLRMTELLVEMGADSNVTNNNGKIPLQLAIQAGEDELVAWYASQMSSEKVEEMVEDSPNLLCECIKRTPGGTIPLLDKLCVFLGTDRTSSQRKYKMKYRYVDPAPGSIDITAETPLRLIVQLEARQLITHPLIKHLLDVKWSKYVRFRFYFDFICYIVYLICVTHAVATEQRGDDKNRLSRFTSLIYFTIGIWYTISELNQFWRSKWVQCKLPCLNIEFTFSQHWLEPYNIFEMATYALVSSLPILQSYRPAILNEIASAAIFLVWIGVLKFSKGSSTWGPLVLMIVRMLFQDLPIFLGLAGVLIFSFGASMFVLLKGEKDLFETILQLVYPVFGVGDIEPGAFYSKEGGVYGVIMAISFGITLITLLLNVVIAAFSDTYAEVKSEVEPEAALMRATYIIETDEGGYGIMEQRRQHWKPAATVLVSERIGELAEPTVATAMDAISRVMERVVNLERHLRSINRTASCAGSLAMQRFLIGAKSRSRRASATHQEITVTLPSGQLEDPNSGSAPPDDKPGLKEGS